MQHIPAQMLQMQHDMVTIRAGTAAFHDLHGHRAADHVTARQILGGGRIAFHETLALGIGQVAALAARALRDQAAGAENARRVELHELHVLVGQARPRHHAVAVAGAGVGAGAGKIAAAIAARRQDRLLALKAMDRAVVQIPGDDAAAIALRPHDQVDREIFDEKLGLIAQALLIERVQQRVARAVRGGTGALGRRLAIFLHMAAEGALIDLALVRAAEGHAEMLELDDGRHGVAAHVFDRVLVAQPVRPLDRVVHMPVPVVLAHIAERGGDATLGRDGVGAGGKHLGHARGFQARLHASQHRAQAGAAAADNDDIIGVIVSFIRLRHGISLQTRS